MDGVLGGTKWCYNDMHIKLWQINSDFFVIKLGLLSNIGFSKYLKSLIYRAPLSETAVFLGEQLLLSVPSL